MIDFEVRVDGPFSKQHPLVKVGCAVSSLLFLLLGNYVPLALAVWLIVVGVANPAQRQPPVWAWLLVAGVLFGMAAIGCYCIVGLVGWFTRHRLTSPQLRAVLGVISLVSVAVATTAAILGHWSSVFLGAFVGVFLIAVVSIPIISVGQVLEGRRGKS